MADFTTADMGQVHGACAENIAAIGESFDQCFLTQSKLSVGELQELSEGTVPGEIAGSGVLVTFQVGGTYVLAAISESLPLPDWCRKPGMSESSRLQTLPVEWSMNVFPAEWECDASTSQFVEDLGTAVGACEPVGGGSYFTISAEGGNGGIYVLGPCRKEYVAAAVEPEPPEEEPVSAPIYEEPPLEDLSPEEARARIERDRRIAQVMNMPVPIIVVMAEKKIELGQLLTMGPGTIISFEKSCDDLLDLCVNNKAICSGEAVKIGEKFGLKINELQSTADRLRAMQRSRVM